VAIQGVANTGNTQNQIGLTQFGAFDENNFNEDDFCEDDFCEDLEDFCDDFFFDQFDGFDSGADFEFEDVGASIDVNPTLTFESDQSVNQSAVAVGKGWWY
jgi:hypothetical protein